MSDHEQENIDVVFGKAVLKGAIIGWPIMLVFITLAVFIITDQTLMVSITTSLLSGTLLGVFGGGFIGSIPAMKQLH
jgi:hypothetical protein